MTALWLCLVVLKPSSLSVFDRFAWSSNTIAVGRGCLEQSMAGPLPGPVPSHCNGSPLASWSGGGSSSCGKGAGVSGAGGAVGGAGGSPGAGGGVVWSRLLDAPNPPCPHGERVEDIGAPVVWNVICGFGTPLSFLTLL